VKGIGTYIPFCHRFESCFKLRLRPGRKFRLAPQTVGSASGRPINTTSLPRDCSLRASVVTGFRCSVNGILTKPIFIVVFSRRNVSTVPFGVPSGHRGRDWFFFGETCEEEGQPIKVRLLLASRIPIKRHVKARGEANPYDPACETYFEKREGDHMLETFRGTHTLRYLWYEQRGLCSVCNTKITRITGWRLDHYVPRVMGGSKSTANRVLLHRECHDRVHDQGVPVSKPRLAERGVQRELRTSSFRLRRPCSP
jgi:hypothetical protein